MRLTSTSTYTQPLSAETSRPASTPLSATVSSSAITMCRPPLPTADEPFGTYRRSATRSAASTGSRSAGERQNWKCRWLTEAPAASELNPTRKLFGCKWAARRNPAAAKSTATASASARRTCGRRADRNGSSSPLSLESGKRFSMTACFGSAPASGGRAQTKCLGWGPRGGLGPSRSTGCPKPKRSSRLSACQQPQLKHASG